MTPNNRSIPIAILSAAVALWLPLRAGATLARAVSFDEKVERAAAIVQATCVKTESRWDDSKRNIVTYSTFRIGKAYKGQASQEITILTPGGSVDGVNQSSIGIPSFDQGSEHIIFVRETAVGPTVLFQDQGAYDVVARGNEKIVQPIASDAVLVDTQRGMAVAREEPRTLNQFETAVRTSMREGVRNRMEILREQKQKQTSLWSLMQQNRLLIALAVAGIALATWRLIRR